MGAGRYMGAVRRQGGLCFLRLGASASASTNGEFRYSMEETSFLLSTFFPPPSFDAHETCSVLSTTHASEIPADVHDQASGHRSFTALAVAVDITPPGTSYFSSIFYHAPFSSSSFASMFFLSLRCLQQPERPPLHSLPNHCPC